MIYLLIACGIIMLASLSGKLLVWRTAGVFLEKNLHYLVSFAAGVFLLFAWQLSGEVFEHMNTLTALLWIFGGGVVITLSCRWLPHTHEDHSHDHDHAHAHSHAHLDPHRMLISDSVHNVGDGVLLAATFAISPVLGGAAALSVFLHEIVQETSEFFVLRDAGYSTRRALWLNFATSSTILFGALGGWFILESFESVEGILLAVATGGVLSVIFFDLLPHTVQHARAHTSWQKHIFWFLAGTVLMFGVATLAPHVHPEHEEEHHLEDTL